jgi:hypothetical protein
VDETIEMQIAIIASGSRLPHFPAELDEIINTSGSRAKNNLGVRGDDACGD